MTDVVDILTGYIGAGAAVLPLHNIDPTTGRCTCRRDCGRNAAKHPRTPHGKDDATLDVGQLAEWLARWPGCNWGLRPPVGVAILDIDPRNGGLVTLAELQAEHGTLPPTLTARTGSGGEHRWFTYNGPSRGKLGDGLDIKTNTGYVVVPPSVHACGGRYEWVDMRAAAYAPAWMKAILNPPIVVRRGLTRGRLAHLVKFVVDSPEGQGNDRLYWAACRALEDELDPAPLVDAAIQRGTPALEAAKTVASAEHRRERGTAPRKATA